ncbi:MAG: cytochrome C oxidase subunit IV family protein [Elusimicrobia bacterium]|nr:cytochrome C oxidase subunit IV family protein [Elusimicrobiota bacterium]
MSKGHHPPNIKLYLGVFAALMVLTVVTVLVSYLHLPKALGIALGLAIALFKASLVAAFFMHLKGERALIYGVLAVTVFFVAVLYILPIVDFELIADVRIPESISASIHHEEHVP